MSALSGGECQRIKMASELHKKGSIYVLDEPPTGLHPSDVTHGLSPAIAFQELLLAV
ncbi:MAG TPA: hypothetical protein VK335_07295 [Bryobacteraceae bacterium]|nr:hypothetical protein [Bryobacteraceae bacterium]